MCAGRVDESLLCTLAACGVREAAVLCGRCDRCAQRHGAATAVLVAETAQTLLDVWGASLAVRVTDEVPQFLLAGGVTAAEAAQTRDDFFAEGRACVPVVREGDAAVDGPGESGGAPEARDAGVAVASGASVDGNAMAIGDVGVDGEVAVDGAIGVTATAANSSADDEAASNESVAASLCEAGRGPVSLSSPEAEAADTTAGPGLRFFWNSGRSRKVASHSLHVMKDGTLPHFVPDRRERLLDALAALGEPADSSVACRLWGTVVIDGAKCVSCRMCATFCPTGAIEKFDDADGALGVMHRPADCVKCGSCADICPADAITVLDEVRAAALMDGDAHRYVMTGRPVDLTDNPHQILDTFRLTFNGDIFER